MIGIDSAMPHLVEQHIAQGHLTTLNRLKEIARLREDLAKTEARLSPRG